MGRICLMVLMAILSAFGEGGDLSFSAIEDYGTIADKEMLTAMFGEEFLVHGESWYAEGTVRLENTMLTDPDNGWMIRFLWENDGRALGHLEADYYIYDEYYSIIGTQEVSSECGVHTGMSLFELREWNGGDFSFTGFGWDYGGAIMPEAGSRLAECPVLIELSFELEAEVPERYFGLYGDVQISTGDDQVQEAPVLVSRLTFYPE